MLPGCVDRRRPQLVRDRRFSRPGPPPFFEPRSRPINAARRRRLFCHGLFSIFNHRSVTVTVAIRSLNAPLPKGHVAALSDFQRCFERQKVDVAAGVAGEDGLRADGGAAV